MRKRSVKPRAYNNAGRAEQARRTRARVIDAARDLLLDRGYAATTIADVAVGAGVSAETVYKACGNKAALTKQVYDTMLAGDDAPIPIRDRPEAKAVRTESDPTKKAARYAALARALSERVGPLLGILVGARGADPELTTLTDTMNAERLTGARMFVRDLAKRGSLRAGLTVARATDTVWTLISPEVYLLLVHERGWSLDDYEAWIARSLADNLFVRT